MSECSKCGNSEFSFVLTEIIRDQLFHLNIQKSMEPDRIHPRVLKEVLAVMARPLLIMC